MRRIVLCADDYALSPGVSAGIRELISTGRINATSVMTIFPEFQQEAKKLQETKSPKPFQIGLHVTLTGNFNPLSATPIDTLNGRLPMQQQTWPPFGYFRIDPVAVKIEVKAQLKKFIDAFQRLPDYVDGHQHVQLMPGIRGPFLEAVKEYAPKAWVRQCARARLLDEVLADSKGGIFAFLNYGFRAKARLLNLKYNSAFTGAYDYSVPRDFAPLFAHFIRGLPEGGVVMCHPGYLDETLKSRDTLTDQREKELIFLLGDDMPRVLAQADVTLS